MNVAGGVMNMLVRSDFEVGEKVEIGASHSGCRVDFRFALGDKVMIDGDQSIVAIVTTLEWRGIPRYEVSYIHAGDTKFCVFDEWRLTHPPK